MTMIHFVSLDVCDTRDGRCSEGLHGRYHLWQQNNVIEVWMFFPLLLILTLLVIWLSRMPDMQRGPCARMGRSLGFLCRKPRGLQGRLRREDALQTGGEEMQELWHVSRKHCWCQQTNLEHFHQWQDKFSRRQVKRVENQPIVFCWPGVWFCLLLARCSEVRPMITKIVNLMTVPLIQVRFARLDWLWFKIWQ